MEYVTIAALLEKYWQAETTLDEEQVLADYFRQPSIDIRLEPYRNVFGYFEEESKVRPGKDLESRILRSILATDQAAATTGSPDDPGHRPAIIRTLAPAIKWYAAAAVVLCITLFSVYQPVGNRSSGLPAPLLAAASDTYVIKDTYDDPKQALAAIQKALLTVSVNMNKERDVTGKQMHKMSDAWRTAMTN